ncbi:MAG: prepilin-type N-terminal cleavage/methylation domain-containing protein, partial [Proteobacteria bacterium]|nr:prepilin-type N-terminal cleavage/methylation domain-containing protein [Pseudomonadota bacterium]
MKYKYNNYNGFTLVELAMVLFILALLLGTLLTPLATSIEQQDRETTTKLLEDIRDSLLGYAIVNGHFPCPDCSDTVTGSCATVNTVDSSWINNGEEDGVD